MDQISMVLGGLLGTLLMYTGVSLTRGILQNVNGGLLVRDALAARLGHLPLAELLRQAGMEARTYLYREPLHQVENALRACESCSAFHRCARGLREGHGVETFTFCPNYRMLRHLPAVPAG